MVGFILKILCKNTTDCSKKETIVRLSTEFCKQPGYLCFLYVAKSKNVLRPCGEERGAVLAEEVFIAESPKNADAGHAGVARREDIDIAVADVDGTGTDIVDALAFTAERAQGSINHVGSRLATDALLLADGDIDEVFEIGVLQCSDTRLELVADDGNAAPATTQLAKERANAVVEACLDLAVFNVVSPEAGKDLLILRMLLTAHGTRHKQADAVAHHHADSLVGVGGQTVSAEGMVDGIGKILQGIEEGAVEVEDNGVDGHSII